MVFAPLVVVMSAGYIFRTARQAPMFYGRASAYVPSQVEYAKIKKDCHLFTTSDISDLSYRNVKFILPESYFVVVLSHVSSSIARVDYDGQVGYVDASKIKVVDFVPIQPTLEGITFDISSKSGTHIRLAPSDSAEILEIVPAGASSLIYVGQIVGDIPVGGSSNIWYLAVYTPSSSTTSVIEGYVYSERTTNLTPIKANAEDIIEPPKNEEQADAESFAISGAVKGILIALICLPILLVFILLLVGQKRSTKRAKDIEKELSKPEKPAKKSDRKIHSIDELEGQPLSRKETFLNRKKEASASLKPVFPTYEVIDDDDLL